ncbi:hypothetical protein C1878_00120 [Gordonibacter sp. 28C]|nr:hypothetical protein C1878_00120 [Gordonibacter sp. 28C]
MSRDTTQTSLDIDLGTVDDQPEPKVATESTDKADGDHVLAPEAGNVVVDEVSYATLVPGKTYTVRGTLMDKATGKPAEIDGAGVTAEKRFAPFAPFGTVAVEFAFDASTLAGRDLVAFESLEHEDREIAAHADIYDEGQTVAVADKPEISTVATDAADGDHEASADSTVRIEDQVFYSGLVPGEPYRIEGILMDAETGEPVLSGGKTVEGEVRFAPLAPSGCETVTFEFDGSALRGHDVVAFEALYRAGEKVCEHADIADAGQTVHLGEPAPEIGTTATDADDGDHEAVADEEVTIVDEVRYENLVPGKEYVLTGTLIDKQAAKPVEKDGLPLASVVAFVPEEPNGSVEVTFSFDGSALAGHTAVAFESLSLDGAEVAAHADIDDAGQSVELVEPPAGAPPSRGEPNSGLPQTGDTAPLIPFACAAGATACIVAIAALGCRRKHDESAEKAADQEGGE